MAQVTALKEQNAKLIEGKKNADARESNTAELAKNKGLLSFNSSKDTLSYSLGAYYSKKIIQDSAILERNGLQISKEYITSGINDAFSNQLKIDDKEIESSLSLINDAVSKSLKQKEKLLRSKVGSKVFKKGSDGTFFVLKRKGTTKYNKGDVVRFSVYEKKIDGTPILNTINSSLLNDEKIDPMMREIIDLGLKNGEVILYGIASDMYKTVPEKIKNNDLIEITFKLF